MEPRTIFILTGVIAAATGLLVGGLIGHFATKSNMADDGPSTSAITDNTNVVNKTRDEWNRQFLFDKTTASKIKETNREYSRKPHLAGSARNDELADMVENTWKGYGFETKKDVYNVLLSYPGGAANRNQAFILKDDDTIEFESQKVERNLTDNADPDEIVPPFNGYAKAGDVKRTRAFYVNYCTAGDFDYIVGNLSLNLTDSIVICRYGQIFRGNKVVIAEEHGVAGVIIYNDPEDSVDLENHNATYEETFPNSWFLPPSGVERGSIMEFSGDPLTAGFPAKEYAIRKSVEQVRDEDIIPGIPTQPVGYDDAKKFLNAIGGAPVPEAWKGELDGVTYTLGGDIPDNKKFHLKNFNTDERKDITNVFGYIRGAVEPDRYIIMGNHRDAWMNGAVDAISGTSIMMETSRVFSELMKEGWRPRRTIIFASWDGEEYGIIGSIEWLDDIRVLMADRGVAYLNCDSGVVYNQVLRAGASPLLKKLMYDTAKMIDIPTEEKQTLYEQWWKASADVSDSNSKPRIGDLGSGSDHTGFYHRHGVTSLDVVYYYDKEKLKVSSYYPLYHTSYDTFEAIEKFVDPDFMFHKALSQFFTEMARNLADSVMIPFVVNDYAIRLQEVFIALNAVVRPKLEAKNETLTESLDHLDAAIGRFSNQAVIFDNYVQELADGSPSWSAVRRVNDQLRALERAFLYPLGINDRKYIKHVVFAPSATDSYASAAFPGITDALYKIEQNDEARWLGVYDELTKAVYTVESATKSITKDIVL